jgi:hypothetical protein
MEDNSSISFNDFDVDGCNISEVILFLQKLALSLMRFYPGNAHV